MNSAAHQKAAASQQKWTEALWQWTGVLLGVCLFYILSVGPAMRLCEEGWLSKVAVSRLYRPLAVIRGTPLDRLLNTYVRFWLPPPPQVAAR